MIPPNAKFGAAIFLVFLFTEIVEGNERILGEPLTMDTVIRDTCSRSLSTLIFQICTGNMRISDVPSGRLSNVRGKRASMLFKDRLKRQIADECCLNACSVSQLVQYCPETCCVVVEKRTPATLSANLRQRPRVLPARPEPDPSALEARAGRYAPCAEPIDHHTRAV
ncbi:unnamed protein product [Spodoptera exigua]|nr:unnamed protein product [Spodoptera exigua]